MANLSFTRTPGPSLQSPSPASHLPTSTDTCGYSFSGARLYTCTVKPHLVSYCSVLQSIQVLLRSRTAFWHVSHSSQLCIISKPSKGAFCPFIQVTNEVIEQDQTQYWLKRLCAVGQNLLSTQLLRVSSTDMQEFSRSTRYFFHHFKLSYKDIRDSRLQAVAAVYPLISHSEKNICFFSQQIKWKTHPHFGANMLHKSQHLW